MREEEFREQLSWGKEAEETVADYLRSRGWKAIFEGGVWLDPEKNISFVEVKRKKRWVKFRGEVETGFSANAYEDYKRVADETKLPCFVVFVQEGEDPGRWWLRIGEYEPRRWDGKSAANGSFCASPIVLWKKSQLRPFE